MTSHTSPHRVPAWDCDTAPARKGQSAGYAITVRWNAPSILQRYQSAVARRMHTHHAEEDRHSRQAVASAAARHVSAPAVVCAFGGAQALSGALDSWASGRRQDDP